MPDLIDTLTIEINAEAKTASDGIDKLCANIDKLTNSLKSVENDSIVKMSKCIDTLNNSLERISKINTDSFRNIANSVKTLSKINVSNLTSVSSSFIVLKKGIEKINNINFNPNGLNNISESIRMFGYKTSTAGTKNLSSLKTDLADFVDGLNRIKTVDFDLSSLQNLISNISKLGNKSATKATENLQPIKEQLLDFVNGLNSAGKLEVSGITELTSSLSKLGGKSVTNSIKSLPLLATEVNNLMATLSKSPQVSQNIIDMTNALANLASQGSKVGSASKSIANGLNRANSSATKASKSFKGLASAFGKFYANCFLAIRGVKALWKSINSTADYLEAFNYFEVALNKVGGDWAGDWEKYSRKLGVTSAEEYANSFKTRLNESLKGLSGVQISVDVNGETGLLTDTGLKNLGLNIQEVTQYASQLASVTNSVGQTGETTLAVASAFTKLGADMSSLFNTDYSTVMNNLQSALIGQSRAVYRYGSDITNASLQTLAYSLNIEKAVSEMTQAEKMQLRIIKILQDTKVAWGDQANRRKEKYLVILPSVA